MPDKIEEVKKILESLCLLTRREVDYLARQICQLFESRLLTKEEIDQLAKDEARFATEKAEFGLSVHEVAYKQAGGK